MAPLYIYNVQYRFHRNFTFVIKILLTCIYLPTNNKLILFEILVNKLKLNKVYLFNTMPLRMSKLDKKQDTYDSSNK